MNDDQSLALRLYAVFSDTLILYDELWIGLAVVKNNELSKFLSSRLSYNTVVSKKTKQINQGPNKGSTQEQTCWARLL